MIMTDDQQWVQKLKEVLGANHMHYNLDNQRIAELMDLSERQLYRKVRELLEMTPQRFLREYRLQRAMRYLESGTYATVNEVAFATGYVSVGYFIKQFEEKFGRKPLSILREHGWR